MSKRVLRLISLGMLVVAVVFVAYALNHPEAGQAFYVFGVAIGASVWRIFYGVYLVVMVALFVASFFVGRKGEGQR